MPLITSLEPQVRNPRRFNLYVDGKYVGSLSATLVEEERLSPGLSIADEQLARILEAEPFHRALDSALTFLSYRPRSEREVRQRLRQKGHDPARIDQVVERLRQHKLLDDAAFTTFWVENRQGFSARGERLLRLELRQKGVDAETIDEALEEIDEESDARRAAEKQARRLAGLDYREFCQKLGAFLHRRGFDYDTVQTVVRELWAEREASGQ